MSGGVFSVLSQPSIQRKAIIHFKTVKTLECVSSGTIRKFEQILCQFKEETRRLSSAKSRVDDAEMAQRYPKLRIKEFLRHSLEGGVSFAFMRVCPRVY